MLFFLLYFLVRVARNISSDMSNMAKDLYDGANPAEAVLVFISGDDEFIGRRFAFDSTVSIGRSRENDIVIPLAFVSHKEAVIRRRNNLFIVEGLSEHTALNGRELRGKAYLRSGDILRIGTLELQFMLGHV